MEHLCMTRGYVRVVRDTMKLTMMITFIAHSADRNLIGQNKHTKGKTNGWIKEVPVLRWRS